MPMRGRYLVGDMDRRDLEDNTSTEGFRGCSRGRRRGQSGLPLIQDGGGGGGTDTGAAGVVKFQHLVQSADAAGGFDADFLGKVPPHQGNVRQSVAGGSKTRGGFDEIDFGALAAAAGDDLQFVGEVGVFQDDLEQRAFLVAEFGHLEEFHLHVLKLARYELGDGDYHVDLPSAAAQQVARFVELGGGVLGAVREAADGPRLDAAALQGADRQIDIAGPHADAGDAVAFGEFQPLDHLFIGEFRFDQRMVDEYGQRLARSERAP